MFLNPILWLASLSIFVLPYLFSSMGASSWALGLLFGSVLTLAIAATKTQNLILSRSYVYPFAFLFLNILVSCIYFGQPPTFAQIGGIGILVLFLLFAALIGSKLSDMRPSILNRSISRLTCTGLLIGLTPALVSIKLFPFAKSILYFGEPSHFAIALSPLLFYFILVSKRITGVLVSSTLLIEAFYLENTILLILWMLANLMLLLRWRRSPSFIVSVLLLGFSAVILVVMNSEYFLPRIMLDQSNISSLVFLRGFESARASLTQPPFIGVGFQMMQARPFDTDIVNQLTQLDLGYLNAHDGGFVAAKFITEFGWLAFPVLCYFLFSVTKAILSIMPRFSVLPLAKDDAIFIACSLSTLVQLFVRGAGYLGPFVVLLYLVFGFMPKSGWLRT